MCFFIIMTYAYITIMLQFFICALRKIGIFLIILRFLGIRWNF